jgi:hypothetical protein
MRDFFPFTNFDFYAYVFTGLILLACLDYVALPRGQHLLLVAANWKIVPGIVMVACGYVVGQIVGLISTLVIEFFLFSRRSPREAQVGRPGRRDLLAKPGRWGFFYSPSAVLLELEKHGKFAQRMLIFSATRYFRPLPERLATQAIAREAYAMGTTVADIKEERDRETVFQYGFTIARGSDDTCRRMDRDRREYEFSRNLSMVALVCCVILLFWAPDPGQNRALICLPWVALIVGVAMLARFVKYYASFHSQVIRAAALGHLAEKDRKMAQRAAEHEGAQQEHEEVRQN